MAGLGASDNSGFTPAGPDTVAAAVNAAPIGLAVIDLSSPDHPVATANETFARLIGRERDALIGLPLRAVLTPDAASRVDQTLERAVAQSRTMSCEFESPSHEWLGLDLGPLMDRYGDSSHCVAVLHEATGHHLAEAIRSETERRLAAVTGTIPLPMLTVDGDGIIAEANQVAHEALGLPPTSLIGRPLAEFVSPGEDGAHQLWRLLREGGTIWRVELRARRADDMPLWVLLSAKKFADEDDCKYLIIFQDVTELKKKEEALTRANEEAERTIRARMRFLAAASHDLRQPLQALALFASALDHHVATDKGRTIVQSIKVSLRGMEEMFDSLMDMSKLDAGVLKAERQVFLLGDVFTQLEASYRPLAEAAGLDFIVVPTSRTVCTDPRLLTRILGNFLSNAIRYTRSGKIMMGCRQRGDQLEVGVFDTGPGIPENQRLEIFREFKQVGAPAISGRGAGMGLGLAIVQRLALLLNHRLNVRSVEGRGSCFSVEIPWAEEAAEDQIEGDEDDLEDVPDLSGATIVVVDDHPDIQTGLAMILTDWGCRAVVTETAEAAVAELTRKGLRPDAILADLHLHREGEGIDAIRLVRQGTGVEAPAFLFTGDTEASGPRAEAGFPVLNKPLDPLRLRLLLAEAMGR